MALRRHACIRSLLPTRNISNSFPRRNPPNIPSALLPCARRQSPLPLPNRAFSSSRVYAMPVKFSSFDVSEQIFFERDSCVGIVNLKPLVPCHVLIIPRKPYARLADVPASEVAELFNAVQLVGSKIEALCGASALTISLQDGAAAGQSVPHVHVHILPRKEGDFVPNDAIYAHLDRFGLGLAAQQAAFQSERGPDVDDEERKPRTAEQMREEAAWLRGHFQGRN